MSLQVKYQFCWLCLHGGLLGCAYGLLVVVREAVRSKWAVFGDGSLVNIWTLAAVLADRAATSAVDNLAREAKVAPDFHVHYQSLMRRDQFLKPHTSLILILAVHYADRVACQLLQPLPGSVRVRIGRVEAGLSLAD